MTDIKKRVERLTVPEIRIIGTELKKCYGFHHIMKGGEAITHADQAEARTVLARHEFPVSKDEVEAACKAIMARISLDPTVIVYPEEIFPQEIG